jgi:hypothetical protein
MGSFALFFFSLSDHQHFFLGVDFQFIDYLIASHLIYHLLMMWAYLYYCEEERESHSAGRARAPAEGGACAGSLCVVSAARNSKASSIDFIESNQINHIIHINHTLHIYIHTSPKQTTSLDFPH